MKIILNFIPPTINKYIGKTNWQEYQRDKKKIHQAVKMSTIGINPKYKSCKIRMTYYFEDKKRRDTLNYDKMIMDGLVEANIIEDDNYDVVKEITIIGSCDKDNPRVEIEIEEV